MGPHEEVLPCVQEHSPEICPRSERCGKHLHAVPLHLVLSFPHEPELALNRKPLSSEAEGGFL